MMTKMFITYADNKYQEEKDRLLKQCYNLSIFDKIKSFGPEDVSEEIKSSVFWKIPRGGGLWSWKPDVIYSTIGNLENGDYLVYCDAGCSVYHSKEWDVFWGILNNYDIIAQLLFKQNEQYTRKEIIEYFNMLPPSWIKCFQYEATIILKVSDFTRQLVKEWRDVIIANPFFIMDVEDDLLPQQSSNFVENRHDQAVYSALIYKYLLESQYSNRIYTIWERIEDVDIIQKQAIRATRLRYGGKEIIRTKSIVKRLVKHYLLQPFYYRCKQNIYLKKCVSEKNR